MLCVFFFFKQKTAYEMRISDWSSDVCSSDLTYIQRLTCHFQARNTDSITNINTNAREAHLWITSYSESRKARKAPPLGGFAPAGPSLRSPVHAKAHPRPEASREGKEWCSTCRHMTSSPIQKEKKSKLVNSGS